jgi:hypothetical protein
MQLRAFASELVSGKFTSNQTGKMFSVAIFLTTVRYRTSTVTHELVRQGDSTSSLPFFLLALPSLPVFVHFLKFRYFCLTSFTSLHQIRPLSQLPATHQLAPVAFFNQNTCMQVTPPNQCVQQSHFNRCLSRVPAFLLILLVAAMECLRAVRVVGVVNRVGMLSIIWVWWL